ncbi:CapA family protein [Robiginitalea sp. M366]|uniref:CapA family protein n=1 Tax=Robiginitalea aestuariiviva TaxID=3036903 RepID=UPI00240E714D|nr:CapA family protein [Robiginitalea aestuariiviva]MDG1572731.1 CapA family protein [Robiginitalea aestuariiviva]
MEILITGDFCPINRTLNYIETPNEIFGELLPEINKADLAITNLECPLTSSNSKIVKTGPCIKAPESAINFLKEAGFKLVTLANNHIMDFGLEGLEDTLRVCEESGIQTVGANLNKTEAQKPFLTTIEGKKLAVINIAENEFCTATDSLAGANPLDLIQNYQQIIDARKTSDFVIVIYHGGREHYQLPTPRVRNTFRFFIEVGADVVVAHHPHCFSGYEIHRGRPIFYSLGNFIFDFKRKYQKGEWTKGAALRLSLSDGNTNFALIPFYQGRQEDPRLKVLLPEQKEQFDSRIKELNRIITTDDLFEAQWRNYIKTQSKGYRNLLRVKNKYLRKLISMGLLPQPLNLQKSHDTLLLNLFKCETHHEIFTAVLDKDLY